MNSVEGPSLRSTAAAAAPATASRAGSDGPAPPAPASAGAPPAGPVADTPAPSLASLFDQARAAQAELAGQPLPITNHHHRFIMNLFGG